MVLVGRLRVELVGRARAFNTTLPPRHTMPHQQEDELHFRLLNNASGPEVVDLWGLDGPLPPQNPLEKVRGEARRLFQWALR